MSVTQTFQATKNGKKLAQIILIHTRTRNIRG